MLKDYKSIFFITFNVREWVKNRFDGYLATLR